MPAPADVAERIAPQVGHMLTYKTRAKLVERIVRALRSQAEETHADIRDRLGTAFSQGYRQAEQETREACAWIAENIGVVQCEADGSERHPDYETQVGIAQAIRASGTGE